MKTLTKQNLDTIQIDTKNLSNTYYHYKGFEFCISKDNTWGRKTDYYLCMGGMHAVFYSNKPLLLLKKAIKYADTWLKDNTIIINQDYTHYKDTDKTYSNYKYSNTGLHIITPKDKIKSDVTIQDYLKEPLKYKFFTDKKIKLIVLELI